MRDYFACVAGVDENVGRLVQQLRDDELYDNTIIMFSSDQGFYLVSTDGLINAGCMRNPSALLCKVEGRY